MLWQCAKGKFKCKWCIRDISLMISRPCLVISLSLSVSLCGLELRLTSLHCGRWWASCLWSVWAGSIAMRHWYLSDLLCQYAWMIHQLKTHAFTHALAHTQITCTLLRKHCIWTHTHTHTLFSRSPLVPCKTHQKLAQQRTHTHTHAHTQINTQI